MVHEHLAKLKMIDANYIVMDLMVGCDIKLIKKDQLKLPCPQYVSIFSLES